MLRTTPTRRLKVPFQKLRDAYNTQTMRLRDARPIRGADVVNGGGDPVTGSMHFESTQRPLRKNRANETDITQNFMQGDEMAKWLDAEQAAKVLGIAKTDLIGLKPARIEEAWAKLYRANQYASGKKNEISAAAETLLEYVDSELHQRKTKEFYSKTIENMRLEIEAELNKDTEYYKELFMRGAGLGILVGGFIIIFVMYVRRFAEEELANNARKHLDGYMKVVMLRPTNVEPAPDYVTRYRDTPTAIELDRANGVDYDHTFEELATKHEVQQSQKDEEAYLLTMLNEENELALQEAKAAQQSTWRPHDAASNTNKPGDVIVLPITGKVIPRESYEPSLGSFIAAVENKYPSGQHARGLILAEKSEQQEEVLERGKAYQEMLREEKHL